MRGDTTSKQLAIIFTGDEFADGGNLIANTLRERKINASFFFTGRFYRNPNFQKIIQQLKKDGHYLGAHSDQHLLYCDWNKRDSLLVTKKVFKEDLMQNYKAMEKWGVKKERAKYFIPPYEWYNDSIALWTKQLGLQLINFTPGTKSAADYTTPDMQNYRGSQEIYQSILDFEKRTSAGLNGFILLLHIGTDPKRMDKFYDKLDSLLAGLQHSGYKLIRIDELLSLQ